MPVNERYWKRIGYTPHSENQWSFHASNARFKVSASGRRYGKSRSAAAEVGPYMFEPDRPGIGWIVALSYDTADEFQYLYDDIVLSMGLGGKIKKANNPRTGEMYLEMPWGDKCVVKSIKNSDNLVGKGLKWVILSEAAKMPQKIWKKFIRPALADHRGPCIFPSTPEGFNWFKELHDDGKNPEKKDWQSWNFPSWENRVVYPLGFEDPEIQDQMLSTRPEEDPWFWQEIGAQFQSVAGRIYGEFSEEHHIVDNYVYNPAWENYMAFDWGFSNPMVGLDIQVDPSDNVYVWREYYVPQKPIHEHAEILAGRRNPEGYSIQCGYGDSADPGAVETIGRKLCRVIALADAKDVMWGIQNVKKFLRPPRLFISRACPETIHEMQTYRIRGTRNPMEDGVKEEPKKVNDHAVDALRYFIMHHFVLGVYNKLSDYADLVTANNSPHERDRGIFTLGADYESFSLGGGGF